MFNDLNAPRFNTRKYRHNIISKDLYNRWKDKTGYNITFSQFKKYWNLIGEKYSQKIISERDGVKVGTGLGDIYIGLIKNPKKEPIDKKLSVEYGKKIKYENWETRGQLGKIIYGTRGRKYIYRLHGYWMFSACRNLKRSASAALRTNSSKYKNSIEKRSLQ